MLGTELLFWLAKVLIFIYFKIPETYLCLCVCVHACPCVRERETYRKCARRFVLQEY